MRNKTELLIILTSIVFLGIGTLVDGNYNAASKEEVSIVKAYKSTNEDAVMNVDSDESVKPKIIGVVGLPPVDVASLEEELTFETLSYHYDTVLSKIRLTQDQFDKLAMERFLKLINETIHLKLEDKEVEKETAFELYILSNLIMVHLLESGVYDQGDISLSAWGAMLTPMGMLEVYSDEFVEYEHRKDLELNHLGTLATHITNETTVEELSYTLSSEVVEETEELVTSKDFSDKFTEAAEKLSQSYSSGFAEGLNTPE